MIVASSLCSNKQWIEFCQYGIKMSCCSEDWLRGSHTAVSCSASLTKATEGAGHHSGGRHYSRRTLRAMFAQMESSREMTRTAVARLLTHPVPCLAPTPSGDDSPAICKQTKGRVREPWACALRHSSVRALTSAGAAANTLMLSR